MAPSTAGRICDRLVRKRLIGRHRARSDRRAVLVSVTAAGRQVVNQATSRRRALIEEILGKLPTDPQQAVDAALRAFAEAPGELPDSQWPPDAADATPDARPGPAAVLPGEGWPGDEGASGPARARRQPVAAGHRGHASGKDGHDGHDGGSGPAGGRLGGPRPQPGCGRGRGGLFLLALLVGAGSGLGAVAFRYLIYFFTWLATGSGNGR